MHHKTLAVGTLPAKIQRSINSQKKFVLLNIDSATIGNSPPNTGDQGDLIQLADPDTLSNPAKKEIDMEH